MLFEAMNLYRTGLGNASHMRLFEPLHAAALCNTALLFEPLQLSEQLYIFLFFISVVKCRNIAKWYCGS